jgi:hypothetical protein
MLLLCGKSEAEGPCCLAARKKVLNCEVRAVVWVLLVALFVAAENVLLVEVQRPKTCCISVHLSEPVFAGGAATTVTGRYSASISIAQLTLRRLTAAVACTGPFPLPVALQGRPSAGTAPSFSLLNPRSATRKQQRMRGPNHSFTTRDVGALFGGALGRTAYLAYAKGASPVGPGSTQVRISEGQTPFIAAVRVLAALSIAEVTLWGSCALEAELIHATSGQQVTLSQSPCTHASSVLRHIVQFSGGVVQKNLM